MSTRHRWAQLLEYFSESEAIERCGTCDNCELPPEERFALPVDAERQAILARAAIDAVDERAS